MTPKFSKSTKKLKAPAIVELIVDNLLRTITNLPGSIYLGNPQTSQDIRSTPTSKQLARRTCRKLIEQKFNSKYHTLNSLK